MRSAKIPYKLSQAKVMADNWLQNCPQEWDICFWIPYERLFCVSFGQAIALLFLDPRCPTGRMERA
jgi:hypothetical protein